MILLPFVCALVAANPLTDAEQQRFLPTSAQLADCRPGTAIVYEIKGPPAPTPLGRTVSIYFFCRDRSECYVKEETGNYSMAIFRTGGKLGWRYSEGSNVYWFSARFVEDGPHFAEVVRQKQFGGCDIAGMASVIKGHINASRRSSADVEITRPDNDTIQIHWSNDPAASEIRIHSSIEKDDPQWVTAIKTAARNAKPTMLDSGFKFPDVVHQMAVEASAEKIVRPEEMDEVSRKGGFVLPTDREASVGRAYTTQKGSMLFLEVKRHDVPFEFLMYRVDLGSDPVAGVDQVFTKEMLASRSQWGEWNVFLVREGEQLTRYFANSSGLIVKVIKPVKGHDDDLRKLIESLRRERDK